MRRYLRIRGPVGGLGVLALGLGIGMWGASAFHSGPDDPLHRQGEAVLDLDDALLCEARPPWPTMGGVSFVAPRRPVGPEAVASLRRIGAGWVGILPYAFLEPETGAIRYGDQRQWWGERPEGVEATILHAREAGLRVMMKPHLWGRGMGWVGNYAPPSEEAWQRWETDYSEYVLELSILSQELGVELLVVGTELDESVRRRPEFWEELIRRVREVYDGKLTYAANWDGFRDIPFWGELDLIGVDAYFPLSSDPTPSLAELASAWEPHLEALAELCRRHERPVFFPEFGYRSIDGAAGEQWSLPPERDRSVPANLEAQVVSYEALFRGWWRLPWFGGGFLWKWFAEEGGAGPDPRQGSAADYTPQGKPVEAVIRRWYLEGEER